MDTNIHTFIHFILPRVSLADLGHMSVLNRQFATIFSDPETWKTVISMTFPQLMCWRPSTLTWQRYYYELLWSMTTQPSIIHGQMEWHLRGQLHRLADQPAIIRNDGQTLLQVWYQNGQCHRDGDHPAIIGFDGKILRQEWFQYGELHRDGDQPAFMWNPQHKEWYQHGELHRDGDQPAVISGLTKKWYQQGLLHRDNDQPAFVWESNHSFTYEWYQHGMLHRTGELPAIIHYDAETDVTHREWYQWGQLLLDRQHSSIIYPNV
jgi:hypothetical protein